jgi:predicted transposase YdaD
MKTDSLFYRLFQTLPQSLSREEIQKMLELTDVDLKQTRFYQDVFAEGRQEGRQEAEQNLILRQLQRRCGELAPEMREQITRLSLPQLEALGEALLEFRGGGHSYPVPELVLYP